MSLTIADAQIRYQRSKGTRAVCAVAALLIAAMFAAFPILIWPAPTWFSQRSPLDILTFLALPLVFCVCGLGLVGAGLYGAGPEDVDIDLKAYTYRFRRGFPLLARWQSGPLDDIEAIYVRTYQSKSATWYWVTLGWRGEGRQAWFPIGDGSLKTRKDLSLSSHKTSAEADDEVRDLAAKLGVPAEFAGSERFGQDDAQRKKRATAQGALAAVAGLFFLLLLTGPPLLTQFQLDAQGRVTTGRIAERWSGKSSHVRVAYQVNGQSFTNVDDVTSAKYERLTPGTGVSVTYLSSYPQTSCTDASNAKRSSGLLLLIYGVLLLVGGGQAAVKKAKMLESEKLRKLP